MSAPKDAGMPKIDEQELAHQIIRSMAEETIRSGHVDPKGKSDEQLKLEILKCLRDDYLGKLGRLTIDHTNEILEQARHFSANRDYYYACLFYATWSEHWLNGLISTAGERRKLHIDEVTQIIRETSFRGKLTWLPSLLGLPRIADRHRNALIRVMDLRNGFVHYKWQGKDGPTMDREDAEIEQAIARIEVTVKYLQGYVSRKIFGGSLRRVRKMV